MGSSEGSGNFNLVKRNRGPFYFVRFSLFFNHGFVYFLVM